MDLEVLFSGQLLIAALSTGSIYALVAVGLNLIYGTMRMLNIAHGDLAMIGAYVAFWSFTELGINPFLSLPLSVLAAVLLAVVTFQFLVKPVMRSARMRDQAEANSVSPRFCATARQQSTPPIPVVINIWIRSFRSAVQQ